MKREYLPRLAKEHGITEEFCCAVKVLHLHPLHITLYWAGGAQLCSIQAKLNEPPPEDLCGVETEHLSFCKFRRAPQWMTLSAWLIWTLG